MAQVIEYDLNPASGDDDAFPVEKDAALINVPESTDISWVKAEIQWYTHLVRRGPQLSEEEFAQYAPENMGGMIPPEKMEKYRVMYQRGIDARAQYAKKREEVKAVKSSRVPDGMLWVKTTKRWYEHVNQNVTEEDFEKVKPDNILALLESEKERIAYSNLYERVAKKRAESAKSSAAKKYRDLVALGNTAHGLSDENDSDEDISEIMHAVISNTGSKAYMDGVKIGYTKMFPRPAFGKLPVQNAFEAVQSLQEYLLSRCGGNVEKYPKWVVLTFDSCCIFDRSLMARLNSVTPQTKCVSSFGYSQLRSRGKWWLREPSDVVSGGYQKAREGTSDWVFVRGNGFGETPKSRTLVCAGHFLAIRGETLMSIDFAKIAKKTPPRGGRWHLFPFISMKVDSTYTKAAPALNAVVNSLGTMYDDMLVSMRDQSDLFDKSHVAFLSEVGLLLPRQLGR